MATGSFRCPLCSRQFLADGPFPDDQVPRHLDPSLGTPCPGSGRSAPSFLDLPEPPSWTTMGHELALDGAQEPWPRYRRRI